MTEERKKRLELVKSLFPNINLIIRAIDEELCVSYDELKSKTRESFTSNARVIYAHLLREEYPTIILRDIGDMINKDHATIEYYLFSYEGKYTYDKRFNKMANKVINKYKQLKAQNNELV